MYHRTVRYLQAKDSSMPPSKRRRLLSLETERLTLRRMQLKDAEFIHRLLNEPSFLRHIGDKGVRNLDDAHTYMRQGPLASYAEHGFGLLLTLRRRDRLPIGICGLLQRDYLDAPDIGFAFRPTFWFRGYAHEAATAVLQGGHERLGLRRIVAITAKDNSASIRLLEKLGMVYEESTSSALAEEGVKLFASSFPTNTVRVTSP
jgi:RimJ/RimL family protein N-acetyltransferase